eukprot:m.7779 g.7779  ORF g.7779 m.7779 type:complete len:51 (-) comp5299_c0_seq1:24-176(-)
MRSEQGDPMKMSCTVLISFTILVTVLDYGCLGWPAEEDNRRAEESITCSH